jgi:hypothetical protein
MSKFDRPWQILSPQVQERLRLRAPLHVVEQLVREWRYAWPEIAMLGPRIDMQAVNRFRYEVSNETLLGDDRRPEHCE